MTYSVRKDRPNLRVATDLTVEKIEFSQLTPPGQPPRVIGVQMRASRDAQLYCCGVNREIIVCAGAVGTPQLLMLSGLGPAEDLRKLHIPVLVDLPAVGRNLVDVRCFFSPLRFMQ